MPYLIAFAIGAVVGGGSVFSIGGAMDKALRWGVILGGGYLAYKNRDTLKGWIGK